MQGTLPARFQRSWSWSSWSWWCAATIALVLGALPATAGAVATEPPIPPSTTGETVPKPSPAAEISVVTSRGFSAAAATLTGLFTSRGEMIDYVQDARTTPGTFSPQCGLTGQVVMRAGGCNIALGWYNATEGATTPPSRDEIYELVPAAFPPCPTVIDPASSCCDDADFCPLASHDTTQMAFHRWNMPPFSAADIRADARYKGGVIGFAMMGAGSNTQCEQNKYSQLDLNEKSPSGAAWLGAVAYRSTVDPLSYYLAFESLPTTPFSWKGPNNGNDGDFNDFVLYIKGVCPDPGAGGAAGTAGHAGAPGNGGSGGAAGAAGGSHGAGGSDQAAGGLGDPRGGAPGRGGGGGGGITGASASGGAIASGGGGGIGGGSGGGAGASGLGGAPAASKAGSGCGCATTVGDGGEGPAAAGMIILALALRARRLRAERTSVMPPGKR